MMLTLVPKPTSDYNHESRPLPSHPCPAGAVSEQPVRLLAAVMFADIAGYTAMMQRDEQRAIQLRNRQRRELESRIGRFGGSVRQYYGDGVLCTFRSAVEAVRCAKELQQELHREPRVPLRIGIHLGDIVSDSEGIYGDAVNVAARIESLAAPGGICISGKVYDEVRNHPEVARESRSMGLHSLKNVRALTAIYSLIDSHSALIPVIPTKNGENHENTHPFYHAGNPFNGPRHIRAEPDSRNRRPGSHHHAGRP